MEPTVYIASAANRSFLPYFGVMASSILKHNLSGRTVRFLLLSSDITERDLAKYFGLIDNRVLDISLICMTDLFAPYQDMHLEEGFPLEAVFRLGLTICAPDSVNRVLYLDSDLIALQDVTPLFDLDLGDCSIAAVPDIGIIGMSHDKDSAEADRLSSIGIRDPNIYFSSGVMLWDLTRVGEKLPLDTAMGWISENKPRYCDQDCLNFYFQDDVKLLDMKWNVLFDSNDIRVSEIASNAPSAAFEEYMRSRESPAIFHFAGPDKPWHKAVDGSPWFWDSARNSPVYEYVVAELSSERSARRFEGTFDSVWKTFDDLYFRSSEAERIRQDLHVRLTNVEKQNSMCLSRLDELEAAITVKDAEIVSLRERVKKFWGLEDLLHRLVYKVKAKIRPTSGSRTNSVISKEGK